jgi:hypothetical protein
MQGSAVTAWDLTGVLRMAFDETVGKDSENSKNDETTSRQEVVVTGIEVPFWDIVATLIWWALAAIPAALILSFVIGIAMFLFGAFFGWR